MIGDLNGTKAVIEIDFDDGFFSTIGQIEFTQSYNASPIEISNKSYLDYVTYLDEGLSSIQFNLSGNIIYNSDLSYRRLRSFANLGQLFNLRIINIKDNTIISEYKAIVSNMADNAEIGSAVSTSITFLSTFVDESIAKGLMKITKTVDGIGFSSIDPIFSQSELSNDDFIKGYAFITEIKCTKTNTFNSPYFFEFRVNQILSGGLTPRSLKIVIGEQTIFVRSGELFSAGTDIFYWNGNPNGILWSSFSEADKTYPDKYLAPATGCEILFDYLTDNFNDGDEVAYNIFPAKPDLQLIDTILTPGEITNGSGDRKIGFSIPDNFGSLSKNYYSEIESTEVDEFYITKNSDDSLGNFAIVNSDEVIGGNRGFLLTIDSHVYAVNPFAASRRFILNTFDLVKQKIFDQIDTAISLSKTLRVSLNACPPFGGLGSILSETEESLGIKTVGYEYFINQSDFGSFTSAPKTGVVSFQDFEKLLCVVDNTNSLGSITINFIPLNNGGTSLFYSPRGEEFTVLKVTLDNSIEYTIPIKEQVNGSFNLNEYFLDDFEISRNLMNYLEDAALEGRQVITHCHVDNSEKFINK